MTTHYLPQDTLEDRRTLRRLGLVIACFMLATAALAVTIGIVAG
jgi:Na+/H+-dicarboxylate symporter